MCNRWRFGCTSLCLVDERYFEGISKISVINKNISMRQERRKINK